MSNPLQPNNDNSERRVQMVKQELHFSGPLPPPETLEKYEKMIPGAAERILAMAEKQSDHRQQLEKTVITSDTLNSRRGLCFALTMGILSLILSTFLVYNGYTVGGTILGGSYLVSVISSFIYGSQQRRSEREGRRREE